MKRDEFLELINKVNVWKKGKSRAPHKPLLLLLALGAFQGGEDAVTYEVVDTKLRSLLEEFGPRSKSYHPEYPFWYLRNDGLWEIDSTKALKPRKASTQPTRRELLDKEATGFFPEAIQKLLKKDPQLLIDAANLILPAHFPDSYHHDILTEVGLSVTLSDSKSKQRDAAFRDKVLTAYEYRCSVCGLDLRMGSKSIGLEAAHIKWHSQGGPDTVTNGVALCVLHHKLFDFGSFTLLDNHQIVLSEHLHGSDGFKNHLLPFHGKDMRKPQTNDQLPLREHTAWHRKEVFKGEQRGACS